MDCRCQYGIKLFRAQIRVDALEKCFLLVENDHVGPAWNAGN
jgi:hypothetical protein